MSLAEASQALRLAWADYEGRAGQARLLISQYQSSKKEVEELGTRIEDLTQISSLLASYADDQQTFVQGQIEALVSKGLKTIFQEDLSLKIINRMVGRRPEIDFLLVSKIGDDILETSILDSRGGGVAAVAGFLIQSILVLLTPGLRPILFLDEVFAQVSENFEEDLSQFIAELVSKSNLQVVLVTHAKTFSQSADKVYQFSQVKGITKVQEGVNYGDS